MVVYLSSEPYLVGFSALVVVKGRGCVQILTVSSASSISRLFPHQSERCVRDCVGVRASVRRPARESFWAAIIEFFSVCPPFSRKSVLSINQFPDFRPGVDKSLCYLTSPSSEIHFVWARAVIEMNLRSRSEVVGPGEFVRGPVPAPQGRASPFRARRAYNVGCSYCVGSRPHAGIRRTLASRIAPLRVWQSLRGSAHYNFCYPGP